MRRLKLWAFAAPPALLLLLFGLQYGFLERAFPRSVAAVTTVSLAIAGVLVFSFASLRLFERAEGVVRHALESERHQSEQLEALSSAALSLTADLDLASVLQKVVDLARRVIGARYGALAVVGPNGVIEQFLTSGIDPAVRARLGPTPQGHGLLGVVIRERRALRLDEIGSDPRSAGFPSEHPPMHALLAVPIVYDDEVIGSLYLAEGASGRTFEAGDQRVLERFAAQAAIAVANARLYAAAQRLSVVEERERIAMDLHDGVIQSIYGVSLAIQGCLDRLCAEPDEVRSELDGVIARLDRVIGDVRRYVSDLRHELLQDDGFARLVQGLLDSLAAPDVETRLLARGEFGDVPRAVQWELWHVAHEALSNAVRHGHAHHVDLHLTRDDGRLRLAVQDDGAGFDAGTNGGEGHHGLANMRQRVADLGGQLAVLSAPGRGTTVLADVPVDATSGGERHGDRD